MMCQGAVASDGRLRSGRVQTLVCLNASLPLPCALASADGIRARSIIAPSVNVLRRTRRKPSAIRGAAPDVVIGQSTAARAGAHPYHPGEVARLALLQRIPTIQL